MDSCFWGHAWTKWVDILTGKEVFGNMPIERGYPVIVQERRCERCNKVERHLERT